MILISKKRKCFEIQRVILQSFLSFFSSRGSKASRFYKFKNLLSLFLRICSTVIINHITLLITSLILINNLCGHVNVTNFHFHKKVHFSLYFRSNDCLQNGASFGKSQLLNNATFGISKQNQNGAKFQNITKNSLSFAN